jgi:hypothetical protein
MMAARSRDSFYDQGRGKGKGSNTTKKKKGIFFLQNTVLDPTCEQLQKGFPYRFQGFFGNRNQLIGENGFEKRNFILSWCAFCRGFGDNVDHFCLRPLDALARTIGPSCPVPCGKEGLSGLWVFGPSRTGTSRPFCEW